MTKPHIPSSRRLAGVYRPPASASEKPRMSRTLSIAWQSGLCRQAVPLTGTPNHVILHASPSGYEQPARRFLGIFPET